ncbi:MAG: selenide, water dikinase SelD [Ignavibacteria bacterium]|nr:selenide, water dikinase SelD [Ignavibacteria bacterium]
MNTEQTTNEIVNYKLTQYSHGAGCGCKIAPGVLDEILTSQLKFAADPRLIVGNASKDDAAVYDLGDGTGVISTTDFFMPIVDDPTDFGRIASVNAISDVYAMGGTPMMAIAVLGWPINTVPIEAARLVLEGARQACADAGILLAGGHSIDSPEPIFGLAVTGRVDLKNLKTNTGAKSGDVLYLTKPIGVGIITTAQKKGIVSDAHIQLALTSMTTLNKLGALISPLPYVHALTDVTGFGLLGHLIELCEGAHLSATIALADIPLIDADAIRSYVEQGAIPGGTKRNFLSYGHKVSEINEAARAILCDPQTSGGLLISVDKNHADEFEAHCENVGHAVPYRIGVMIPEAEHVVTVD